jgi:hypothetical protein
MSPTYRSGPLTSAVTMFVEIRRGKFPLLLCLRSEASRIFDEWFKTHCGATGIDVPGILYWKWTYLSGFIPIMLSSIDLISTFHGSDTINNEGQVSGFGVAFVDRRLQQRNCGTHQFGFEDSMLK